MYSHLSHLFKQTRSARRTLANQQTAPIIVTLLINSRRKEALDVDDQIFPPRFAKKFCRATFPNLVVITKEYGFNSLRQSFAGHASISLTVR